MSNALIEQRRHLRYRVSHCHGIGVADWITESINHRIASSYETAKTTEIDDTFQ